MQVNCNLHFDLYTEKIIKMKKILFSFMVVCAFQMSYAQTGNEEFWRTLQHIDDVQKAYKSSNSTQENSSYSPQKLSEYVDLGLPSGTLWKDKNEDGGFYTYEEAVAKFGNNLPTKEQLEELKDFCRWSWTGNGYRVEGPSEESIFLPAAGCRDCLGHVLRSNFAGELVGWYWSSTPYNSYFAWSLVFMGDHVNIKSNEEHCWGCSVRLVR